MTELYINGQLAVLPNNVEFSIVEENPFLTKNGEFSFDIELSLDVPENVSIFGHINRFNAAKSSGELTAILVVDSRVRLNGIATVLSVTESKAAIQLLSGNSELNYFINSDKYIRELDLGEAPSNPSVAHMVSTWEKGVNYGYCYAPVVAGGKQLNRYVWTNQGPVVPTQIFDVAIQPYLWYYIQKIPEALGYTVSENVLDNDEVFRRLFVVNGIKTTKFSRVLGSWTIKDFLAEIEKFCNVSFVIDKNEKSVRILRNYAFTANDSGVEFISNDDVLDEYTSEIDGENNIENLDYDAVKYVFSDEFEGKYHDLSPEVLENTIPQNYPDMEALLTDHLGVPVAGSDEYRKLYHVSGVNSGRIFDLLNIELDEYFIWAHNQLTDQADDFYLKRVNDFRTAGDSTGNVVELKICPADMALVKFYNNIGQIFGIGFEEYIPATDTLDEDPTGDIEINEMSIEELIDNGIPEDSSGSSSVIPVAYCVDWSYRPVKLDNHSDSIKGLHGYDWQTVFPLIITDAISSGLRISNLQFRLPHDIFPESFIGTASEDIRSTVNSWDNATKEQVIANIREYLKFTMRLHGPNGFAATNYWKNVPVNSKEVWTVQFISKIPLDVRKTFVIKNRKFICISIETKINATGALLIVEGKFLPVY
ncbi:MAG: hypothetical protein LBV74_01190 [Tannerella sp.]|jgi:hypothetical protein|nr:hypothetical protein [Tannerella sp.]